MANTKRKITTLGPGTFNFGSAGSNLDMSCQLTNLLIQAEGESEDALLTLCGDSVAGARTYAWTVSGTVLQDIEANGVIDYTWKNAGKEVPFKFIPDSTGKAAVTGRLMIDPIALGGDVGKKNTSDFEFAVVGSPVFDADSTDAASPASQGEWAALK